MLSRTLERMRTEPSRFQPLAAWIHRLRQTLSSPTILPWLRGGVARSRELLSVHRRAVAATAIAGLLTAGCLFWWTRPGADSSHPAPAEQVAAPQVPAEELNGSTAVAVPVAETGAENVLSETGFANKYLPRRGAPAGAPAEAGQFPRGAWLTGTIEEFGPEPVAAAERFADFPSRQ